MSTSPLVWEPHADAWLLVVLVLGGYLYALSAWAPRYAPGRRPATTRQRAYFLLGVAVLWLASDWPIHGLSTSMFSVHMFQHMLYSLVAAPLLILGMPGWLLRRLLRPRVVSLVWARVTRPLPALILFNLWIAVYHWPVMVNLSVRNDLAHFLTHGVWVVVSLVMWWPVLSPLPEFPHLSYPARMAYLFAQSIVPTVPASFLTFSERLLYRAYETTPMLWGLSRVGDQQLAGLLMKIVGGFLIWGVLAVMFFRWCHEQETGGPDLLYWRDLEPDLEARQLTQP
jgi:putative membrane protein